MSGRKPDADGDRGNRNAVDVRFNCRGAEQMFFFVFFST